MAKLSAKGNGRELLRIARESDYDPKAHIILKDGTDLGERGVTWERVTRVYFEGGKILEKHDVKWPPSPYREHGELYSYGWKVKGTLKEGITMADHIAKIMPKLQAEGCSWQIERGGPAPVIISQARIVRAIESGEHLGFCKACGATAHSVEPDARNYACESCGAREVYGAEEMLIAGA